MKRVRNAVCGSLICLVAAATVALATQKKAAGPSFSEARIYKQIDACDLRMDVYKPDGWSAAEHRPAILFFHGGGWRSGNPKGMEDYCRYFTCRGYVTFSAQYRLYPNVAVEGCVRDAVSALRWVREHAAELGIDPARIAVGGSSAGGHLAAAVGLLSGFDETNENCTVSACPNAMILLNPALVLAPIDAKSAGFFDKLDADTRERLGPHAKKISPWHHIRQGQPPAIILHGTADRIVPFWTAEIFAQTAQAASNRCELVAYTNAPHGFCHYGSSRKNFISACDAIDTFLVSLGWMKEAGRCEAILTAHRL